MTHDPAYPTSATFLDRCEEITALIKYKNWNIAIAHDGDTPFLQVHFHRFDAIDSSSGRLVPWTGRKWRLSIHMTDSEIVQTALKAVLTAEEHEVREHFLYRGRAIFGPHIDVDRLWDLVGDPAALEQRTTKS